MKTATRKELGENPEGRYFASASFAHFCVRPELWGVLLWGRPSRDEMDSLVRSLRLELSAPLHASIVDASRIESVDASAFELLDRYVRQNEAPLAERVRKLALVRPSGMEGAVVAGFFEVLPRPYPVRLFEDVSGALAWLEIADADGVPEVLAQIYQAVSSIPAQVAELRAVLEARLEGIGVKEAARALGVSDRTLQRRLREAGTSFQDEYNGARVRAAQRLLLDSDMPITQIALEVGCASPQHFSSLFRRLAGTSPSAWRDDNR